METASQPDRTALFAEIEANLHFRAEVYQLGEYFEGLPSELALITLLDVTNIPGCHYGLRNVFVPIIRQLELGGIRVGGQTLPVTPETVRIMEGSTGNGYAAAKNAAERLGYEFIAVMPDGMPQARYSPPGGKEIVFIKSPATQDDIDLALLETPGALVIILTPAAEYAEGIPRQILSLLKENKERVSSRKKLIASPDHSVGSADTTIATMAELGIQLKN
jgi:hypothetical protein